MKASTERKIIRWMHILFSIPILGYLYGPVASIPTASMIVRWILFPLVVLSGLWLWKGHLVRKQFRKRPGSKMDTTHPAYAKASAGKAFT